jgi:hypothetical protein
VPVALEYTWRYIERNTTVKLFIHGYDSNLVGVYNAIPFGAGPGDTNTPLLDVTLTQGRVSFHVNNTYARHLWVQNHAPFNPVGVNLLLLYDYRS